MCKTIVQHGARDGFIDNHHLQMMTAIKIS